MGLKTGYTVASCAPPVIFFLLAALYCVSVAANVQTEAEIQTRSRENVDCTSQTFASPRMHFKLKAVEGFYCVTNQPQIPY